MRWQTAEECNWLTEWTDSVEVHGCYLKVVSTSLLKVFGCERSNTWLVLAVKHQLVLAVRTSVHVDLVT